MRTGRILQRKPLSNITFSEEWIHCAFVYLPLTEKILLLGKQIPARPDRGAVPRNINLLLIHGPFLGFVSVFVLSSYLMSLGTCSTMVLVAPNCPVVTLTLRSSTLPGP